MATDKYKELRQITERVLGMEVKTPRDFELLALHIFQKTRKQLSVSTLKRFWGYVGKGSNEENARLSTLDILSEFIGYQDWTAFCQTDTSMSDNSGTTASRFLFAKEQSIGSHIVLRWQPNRQVTIRYEGDDLFTVVKSINSKLCPGDTFHCSHIVEGLPLTMIGLVRNAGVPVNYVCGKEKGVTFMLR